MNDKGYITAGTLVVILLFSVLYLAIIYGGAINTTKDVTEARELTDVLVQDLNGKERMYQRLLDNPSFEGKQEYTDLGIDFVVETIDEEYLLSESFSSAGGGMFEIKNKTPINISINMVPFNVESSSSYSVELMNNGKDMLNGMGIDKSGSFNYTINDYEVYDHGSGVEQLGEYLINFGNVSNANLIVEITYNQLVERTITLTDGSFIKDLTITIDNNKVKIEETKLMEGG